MGSVVAQAESGLGTVTVAASGIGPETARASKAAGYRVFGTSRKVDRDVDRDKCKGRTNSRPPWRRKIRPLATCSLNGEGVRS